MAVASFNSNVLALRIQRGLAGATEAVGGSYERLSTGMRINRAADDAAGLAIADSLRVDSRLYTAAVRNINDGMSALNIINGALDSQSGILQRMAELAEQSANGTLSLVQRSSLQQEYYSLTQEFGRIGATTSFNGLNLLLSGHGSNPRDLFLQAGIRGNANSVLQVSGGDTGKFSGILDRDGMATTSPSGGPFTADQIVDHYGNKVLRTRMVDTVGVEHEVMIAFRDVGGGNSVRPELFVHAEEASAGNPAEAGLWRQAPAFTLSNVSYNTTTGFVTSSGLSSWAGLTTGGQIQIMQLDLSGLQISSSSGTTGVNLGQSTAIDISGVESVAAAKSSLDQVLRRLESLSLLRGTIGAAQSRLNVALSLNQGAREASSAAESRIRDVDVASESAELVAQQIRQKSATSVLQYANSQPKILLSLLNNVRERG